MRKVIFTIDVNQYFKQQLTEETKCKDEDIENIVKDMPDFKASYILYGNEKQIDKYELFDSNGDKIYLDSLNGFQKGIVLYDCKAYFEGRKFSFDGEKPCGVISIEETEVK